MNHKELSRILRVSYCLSYRDFCKFYGQQNYYTEEKYSVFREDFGKWYCDLDSSNAKRYLDFIAQKD